MQETKQPGSSLQGEQANGLASRRYPARNSGQQSALWSSKESQDTQALRGAERPGNRWVLAEHGGSGMLIRVHYVYMPDFSRL